MWPEIRSGVMLGSTHSTSEFDEADVKPIDGASLVQSLRLDRSIITFCDYAEKKVIPFIDKHLATTNMLMSSGTNISQIE